jgi:hypothetical protein
METTRSKRSKQRLFIAPSSFASHFHFGCERQLIFTASHVDRAKWFYEDPETKEYHQYGGTIAIQLEISQQNGDKEAILLDHTRVDLDGRVHDMQGVIHRIRRSNWLYEPLSSSSNRSGTQLQPLSEENCAKLDSGFFMPSQPVEISIY